jgi:uncharacterized iron-regulated protein
MPMRTVCLRPIVHAILLAAFCMPTITFASDGFVIEAEPEALAKAMTARNSVLLGEVHDNGLQHTLRLEALRRRVEAGARPALAFEQFDRDRQEAINRSRIEQPRDANALIAAAGTGKWHWNYYRPFVQLALDYDLPIIAANLSRTEASKVVTDGWDSVFSAAEQSALGLERLPADYVTAQQRAVARGHCDLLPVEALEPMARAQITRDIVLAQSVRPYLRRGVVLLTGNGHVRRDIGVPYWLSADERADVLSIGFLEISPDAVPPEDLHQRFDAVVETLPAERTDPCAQLRARHRPTATP